MISRMKVQLQRIYIHMSVATPGSAAQPIQLNLAELQYQTWPHSYECAR